MFQSLISESELVVFPGFDIFRIIKDHMTVRVNKASAPHDLLKVRIGSPQRIYCKFIDDKSMLLLPPGIPVKCKRLYLILSDIVESSLCFNVAKLYHPRPDTEMRQMQRLTYRNAGKFKLLSHMAIVLSIPALGPDQFPCMGLRHHEAISAAVSLLLHKVDGVFDHFILVNDDLPGFHLAQVIAVQLLEPEEQVMFLKMDALVEDVKRGIVPADAVGIDHNGIGRDHNFLRSIRLDSSLFTVRTFLDPVLSNIQAVFLEENNAVHHPPVLVDRVVFNGQPHPLRQFFRNPPARICKRLREIPSPQVLCYLIHALVRAVRHKVFAQLVVAITFPVNVVCQFLYAAGEFALKSTPANEISLPDLYPHRRFQLQFHFNIRVEILPVDPPIGHLREITDITANAVVQDPAADQSG